MLAHKKKGFTLIELLVVLVVASILLSSLLAVYSTALLAYQRAMNTARLTQSLQSAMLLMTNDIRRAGFWKNAKTDVNAGSNHNPFMLNDITVNGTNNCILFTYDRNGLGSLPSIGAGTDDERYGFRLQSGAIQSRPSGAMYDCNAPSGNWLNITDPASITITQLTFTVTNTSLSVPAGSGSPTLIIRTVNVSITGQLLSDSTVTKTLNQLVRVHNDNYSP